MVISFVAALTLMLAFIFGPPDATANAIQTRWRLVRGGPILLHTLHLFLHQDKITPQRSCLHQSIHPARSWGHAKKVLLVWNIHTDFTSIIKEGTSRFSMRAIAFEHNPSSSCLGRAAPSLW